jgi:hypothetical protein
MNMRLKYLGITAVLSLAVLLFSCASFARGGSPESINYSSPELYAENGGDTRITDEQWRRIEPEIADGDFRAVLSSAYAWKDRFFRRGRRERGQIDIPDAASLIREGKLYGCHDHGTVLAAVMRRSGYPVVMLDTVGIQWAREYQQHRGTKGHVFLEIYTGERWILADSTSPRVVTDYHPSDPVIPLTTSVEPVGYYVLYKGIDAAAYGIYDLAELGERLKRFAARTDLSEIELPEYEVERLR